MEASTPSSNTGLLKPEIRVRPDWVGLSFRQERLPRNIELFGFALFAHLARQGVFANTERGGWTIDPNGRGFNGFENGVHLRYRGEVRATLQWGGAFQRGWVLLEIRGGLCALLQRRQWISLYRMACKYQARIGHVDLAADDFEGQYFCPHKVRRVVEESPYDLIPTHRANRAHKPTLEWMESPTGCTCYVGSKQSIVRLRVYQKGRQLHDTREGREHPAWVRWESIFKRKTGYELEAAILHPDYWLQYLLGSSKYLAAIWNENGLVATWKPETAIMEPREIAAKGLLTMKEQWGGMIYHYRRLMGSEAFLDWVERTASPTCPLAELMQHDVPYILEIAEEMQRPSSAAADAASPADDLEEVF